jgi:hypothetical protein
MSNSFNQPTLIAPVEVRDKNNKIIMLLYGSETDSISNANSVIGDNEKAGILKIRDGKMNAFERKDILDPRTQKWKHITIPAPSSRFILNGETGEFNINNENASILSFNKEAFLTIGAKNSSGHVSVLDNNGNQLFLIDGESGKLVIKDENSNNVLHFDRNIAKLAIGTQMRPGILSILDGSGTPRFVVESEQTTLRDQGNSVQINLDAANSQILIGGGRKDGKILLYNKDNEQAIALDASTGDIVLSGADCAEEFEITETNEIDSGTVLVIANEGKLRPCEQPYDKRVAGVVSGGNGVKPGIILNKNRTETKKVPIALTGRVYCKVDAQYSPIEVGDLLTTSSTTGHAMKVVEPLNAFGAVIGKALKPLGNGTGLIPIIVSLQ